MNKTRKEKRIQRKRRLEKDDDEVEEWFEEKNYDSGEFETRQSRRITREKGNARKIGEEYKKEGKKTRENTQKKG